VLFTALLVTSSGCGGEVPANPPAPASITVEHLSDRLLLHSGAATAEIRLAPYELSFLGATGGTPVASEAASGGVFYERGATSYQLTRVLTDRPLAEGVELTVETTESTSATVSVRFVTERTLEVTVDPPTPETVTALGDKWDSPDDELIYGLTERLRDSKPIAPGKIDIPVEDVQPVEVGSLNRRGEMVEMYVRPTFAVYSPFFQSSRGYGLAVAGTAVGVFDLAKTDPHIVSFRFEAGNAPASRRLQFHLFYGPEHPTIVDEYTALTGRPYVPPQWAFLNWRWRDELAPGTPATLDGTPMNAQLVDDVTMFDTLGIPPGVYLFDRPVLQGEFGFARFAWDEDRLPNAQAMLQALRRRGYRVITWSSMWACGSGADDNGTQAKQLGYLAPGSTETPKCADSGGTSFILDVTNADMRRWWQGKLHDFIATQGLDGIKLDRGEEFIPSAATDIWHDGRNGREVRNDYPVIQAQIHHDALQSVRGDDFLLATRSAYTGTQHYAIVWGGDIPGSTQFGVGAGTDLGLRSAIISQQRAAFMGFPIWGSDTGGYYEFKNREVFARWIEFSAFAGIMEIGGKGQRAPWDMATDPSYDQEMIDIYRRYTQLRVTLHDYIVTAARQAGETALPIARPLVFAYRDDANVKDRWDEYLFGPDLLVAPVWKVGQRSRDVYFPTGTWRDYWNRSQSYTGPGSVTIDVPLDIIPVFVRGDAQVP
jgi:alpha-D-xyloside xylohydrolase